MKRDKKTIKSLSFPILAIPFILLVLAQTMAQDSPILTIELGGHTATIRELIFTTDGRRLISAGDDKVVRIWDVETGELRRTLRGQIGSGDEGKIYAVALSPDDETLAVGGFTGKARSDNHPIRLFNLNTGSVTEILTGHTASISSLAFSPDGRWLVSGSKDRTVRLWDVMLGANSSTTGRRLKPEPISGRLVDTFLGHTDSVYRVAFSPDSNRVVSASDDDTLRMWRVNDRKMLKVMRGHTDDVNALAYSPDGQFIVSGSYDHTLRLWDGRTGEFIKRLGTHGGPVHTISFSPDGQRLVSACGTSADRKAIVWSIPSWEIMTVFSKHKNTVVASVFSSDGQTIATAGTEADIYLWDAETGEVQTHIAGTGGHILSVAFSPDGCEFAFGKTDTGGFNGSDPLEGRFDLLHMTLLDEIPDEESGRWQRAVEQHASLTLKREEASTLSIQRDGRTQASIRQTIAYNTVRCYTFTPSGEIVVGSTFTLILYDHFGKRKREFIGHTGEVWAVAVSPDGRYLVSGSSDQTVRLWNLKTGELLTSFFIGDDREWIAWTPAGYYKASAGGDHLIGWHVNRGDEYAAEYYYAYQFRRQFYRLDVVERILEEGSVEKAVAAANASAGEWNPDVTTHQTLHMKPPKVRILSPDGNTTTTQFEIHVQAEIVSEEKIIQVTISVNGRPVLKKKRLVIEPIQNTNLIDRTVILEPGNNIISVSARTENAVSQPATVYITYQTQSLKKPNLFLLAVGVSTYADSRYNLRYADKDAKAMANLFQNQAGKLFNRVETKILLNDSATKVNIINGLSWLKQTGQADVAVAFISGHGAYDQNRDYYFIPHDVDPRRLKRTGVNWQHFHDTLSSLPSKALLFVDTCHAGNVTGRARGSRDLDITKIIADLATDESGVVVMASSTGREISVEDESWGHGAFTLALIEGLSGQADYNRDGAVYITEIDNYVTDRVKALTNRKQHPTTQKPTTVRSFPLVLVQ